MTGDLPELAPAGRIVDAVQDALRAAIFGGTLRAGEPLSVPDLARRLNVSRSPVREAVLGLVAQGLAVEQPRRGVVVATIEPHDVVAIHEIREFLEAGAARLCAHRVDAAGVTHLRRILAEQERIVRARDAAGYFRTNVEFHRVIAAAAGNDRLDRVLLTLENQMRIALHRIAGGAIHMDVAYQEHVCILDAIAVHDPDRAEQLMRAHIVSTLRRARQTFG